MTTKPPIKLSILLLATLLAAPALASIPEIPDEAETDASQLFLSRKCEVRDVRDDRTVLLYDFASRETHKIQLSEEVKLRAVKKKEFDGRKKLRFDDMAQGQRVNVRIRKSDGQILRIDVLPKAK